MFEYRSLLDRPMVDPFGWDDVFQGFDRLLSELQRQSDGAASRSEAAVKEENDRVKIQVEVPGLAEKDVRVDFQDGILSVTAERPVNVPEGYAPRRRERSAYRVSRSYSLGDAFDPEKTTAELKDGVLTVTAFKAPAKQKKTITVTAA
ncbi:MAG TPA: Hsp20/alpha crystallin family protein [Polyangiaceae bacterium]|nr:Hsp20/alpha crystallin family protein [Polyangiaceae bacterium]